MSGPRDSRASLPADGIPVPRQASRGPGDPLADDELLAVLTDRAVRGYRIREGDAVGIGQGRPSEGRAPAAILVENAEEQLLLVVALDELVIEALEEAVARYDDARDE